MDEWTYKALLEMNEKFDWLYQELVKKRVITEMKQDGKDNKP